MKITERRPGFDHNDLWDKYFRVKVNYLQSMPMERLKTYGMRVSGIPEIDKTLDRQEISTEMNIDTMFEKHRRGVTIRVVNYSDTAEIYNIIHNHLLAWVEHLSSGINVGNAPLKDLIELDAFAAVVYDKAKSVFNDTNKTASLPSIFKDSQMLNFRNILNREVKEQATVIRASGAEVTKVTNVDPNALPERQSMKELFSEQINLMAKWRNDT